jgi:heme/copper-type cytochrome/quinol oxidase subunit 2
LPTHATPKDSSSKVLLIVTVTVGSVTLTLFVVLVLIIWRVVKKRTGELSLTQPRTQPDGINAGMMTEIFDILLEQRDNGARPAASTSV